MVLGGCADHGGPADVDILDTILFGRPARHRRLKGIKTDHQQVDRRYAMCQHGRLMLGILADRQQPAVDIRMQGFDPPVHHFWKAGEVRHFGHPEPCLGQRGEGAAGRDQRD